MNFLIAVIAVLVSQALSVAVTKNGFDTPSAGAWNFDYSQGEKEISCPSVCSIESKCGPNCWKEIVSSSNMCGGIKQTPVNIVLAEPDASLMFPVLNSGSCSSWNQFSDDHAFEVSFPNCKNISLSYGGETYTLAQLHFHSPSEHTVGGGFADGELHMVHKTSAGSILVVGVLIFFSRIVPL
jgi:carbonic anhydrase